MKNFFIDNLRKKFLLGYSKRAGKNFFGRKTIFTQSGGLKSKLYLIDFKRLNSKIAILLTVEKDYNRTGFIGLVCYENGLFSYILLSDLQEKLINNIIDGFVNFSKINSPTFLCNIKSGNFIYHIETTPGSGAKLAKSAGVNSFIISKNNNFSFLKMNSGWLLKVSKFCIGIIGVVSNKDHHIVRIKNAGKNRKMGCHPKVRGISMNPCDHPHGGGEGKGSPPRAHKTPWGLLAKSPTNKTMLLKKKKFKFKIF